VAFVTVSIAWGTTYGGIKIAVEHFPPFAMAAMRFIVAGVAMMLAFRAIGIPFPARMDWLRILPVGFLLLSLSNSLLSLAEKSVSSSFAALMVNTAPLIFVGLNAWFGERVPRLAWVGLIVGFCGVGVLVLPEIGGAKMAGHGNSEVPIAAWIALIVGPVCWALGGFVAAKRPASGNPLMISGAQTLVGGVGALLISCVSGEIFHVDIAAAPARAWLAIGWLIVVGSWLGFVSYMYCVMRLSSHRTASITYINNIVAVLVGVFFLGESITIWMLAGGATLLLGVYIVNTAKTAASEKIKDSGESDALNNEKAG